MSEREAAASGTVLVRPTGVFGQYTTSDLARPGHEVTCEAEGCERLAVIKIGKSRFMEGIVGQHSVARCERHLTHVGTL